MATLKEQRTALLDQAHGIINAAKADHDRDLTDAEEQQVKSLLDSIDSLDESIARSERVNALIDRLHNGPEVEEPTPGREAAFAAKTRLSLDSVAPKAFTAIRQKAPVAAGSTVVDVDLLPGIIPADRAPLSLLDAVPAVVRSSPVYRYLRESVRTPNATVVAPGDTKPTSTFTVHSVDARLKVIATVSEPVDRFLLEDAPALRDFLSAELVDAVRRAIEAEVMTGDGTGEHFTGLDSISGVQTVPAADDLLTGVRTAITKLQTISIQPSFVAVNPADLEAAQLRRNTSGAFDWAVDGAPVEAGRARAWGVTLIPTPAVPALTAWAIGDDTIQLSTDGALRVDWGTPGDAFTKNQIVLRAETRANLDALRPSGLVKITIVP